jgi:hypothetical protein
LTLWPNFLSANADYRGGTPLAFPIRSMEDEMLTKVRVSKGRKNKKKVSAAIGPTISNLVDLV